MASKNTLKVTTPNDRDIVLTRVFDAPRHLVFEAFTKPELLKRWLLGPPGWEMIECTQGNNVGDKYRYVWRHADGRQFAMHGVCREIVPPERLVRTELMEGCPGESVVTTLLLEENAKTIMITTARYDSRATRDAVIKSGMEGGAAASYDRLAELVSAGSTGDAKHQTGGR